MTKSFCITPRGFTNIGEHDKTIIDNWNAVVKNDDDVYILGDLMLLDVEHGIECMNQLTGNKHIILGNHDTNAKIENYKRINNVVEIRDVIRNLKYGKYHFYVSHFPTRTSNHDEKGFKKHLINLCGHSHTKDRFVDWGTMGLCYHCELDCHNNTPILIDEIIEECRNKYGEESEDEHERQN